MLLKMAGGWVRLGMELLVQILVYTVVPLRDLSEFCGHVGSEVLVIREVKQHLGATSDWLKPHCHNMLSNHR